MKSYGAILKIPALRLLMGASVPADLADWFDYVAVIALLVYGWHEGPYALAFMTLAISLPAILVGPFTAVIVDRSDLPLALVLSNLGRGATTFALIFAPNLIVLLAIVFMRGILDSAFTPARQSALQAITPQGLEGSANGLLFAINQTTKIAGPALGGLILTFYPPQAVFAVNTGLSLVAALLLLFLRVPPRIPTVERRSMWAEAPEGLREFFRNRKLFAVLAFLVAAWGAIFLYDALMALVLKGFGYPDYVFGYVVAAAGVGGIIGAILAGAVPMKRELLWMGGGALAAGALTGLVGVASLLALPFPVYIYLAVSAFKGLSTGFMLVPYRATIQREAPPDRIARVFAAAEAITVLVIVISPFAGSLIASALGVGATFVAGGASLGLVGAVAIASGLRRQPTSGN